MANDAFRITTVATGDLCAQLDCVPETDELDGALADAGYVRLDHGLPPGQSTAIMPMDPPAGRDPGHRAPAIALATTLFHIIHADGTPELERLRNTAYRALETVATDAVGERIVTALAAYAATKDPGPRPLWTEGPFGTAPRALAAVAYETARHRNVITDVAIERAQAAGEGIQAWNIMLLGNMRAEEPVVRVRRHDAADYESRGVDPQIAELIAWIRANPSVETEEYIRYAQMVGVDPQQAGLKIASLLGADKLLGDGARPSREEDPPPR